MHISSIIIKQNLLINNFLFTSSNITVLATWSMKFTKWLNYEKFYAFLKLKGCTWVVISQHTVRMSWGEAPCAWVFYNLRKSSDGINTKKKLKASKIMFLPTKWDNRYFSRQKPRKFPNSSICNETARLKEGWK